MCGEEGVRGCVVQCGAVRGRLGEGGVLPFLSSIVTVSFAHFMRNLYGVSTTIHRCYQAQGYTELSHEELRNWRGRGVPNELHLDSGLSVVTELSRW